MKRHWIQILVAVCVIGIIAGFRLTRKPEGFVAQAWSAVWAKQGQTLYYTDRSKRFWQFNTKTGNKKVICRRTNSKNVLSYDIFPDEKRELTAVVQYMPAVSELYIANLTTRKDHRILRRKDIVIDKAYCLSNDQILFVEYSVRGQSIPVTQIADASGKILFKLPFQPEIVAMDGSGFIYRPTANEYLFYDVIKKKSVKLQNVDHPFPFLYLSSKLAVYATFDSKTDQTIINAMNLKSMKVYKLDWPTHKGTTQIGAEGGISPSLTECWSAVRFRGEETGSKYYIKLIGIPESTVKILRSIEGRK